LFGTGAGLGDILAASANESVLFIPDSDKLTNKIEIKSTLESPWHFNAGYSNVLLQQDSYTTDERAAGFEDNDVMSHVAYSIVSYEATENVTPSAFVRYAARDNKGPSFYSTITSAGVISCPGAGSTSLTDLADVNTATETAGNILVADGTDFESVAMSSEVTMVSSGATTIARSTTTSGHSRCASRRSAIRARSSP